MKVAYVNCDGYPVITNIRIDCYDTEYDFVQSAYSYHYYPISNSPPGLEMQDVHKSPYKETAFIHSVSSFVLADSIILKYDHIRRQFILIDAFIANRQRFDYDFFVRTDIADSFHFDFWDIGVESKKETAFIVSATNKVIRCS